MPKFDPMTGELITEETDGKGTASISENQTDIGQTTEQTGKQFVLPLVSKLPRTPYTIISAWLNCYKL